MGGIKIYAVVGAAALMAQCAHACRLLRVKSQVHKWLDYTLDLSDEMLNDHPIYSDGEVRFLHIYYSMFFLSAVASSFSLHRVFPNHSNFNF